MTISRTPRLLGGEPHQPWVLKRLARRGLLKGKTIGIDLTTLEANAAMKSIARRETQEGYSEYLKRLAEAEGGRQRPMPRRCAWTASGRRKCATSSG